MDIWCSLSKNNRNVVAVELEGKQQKCGSDGGGAMVETKQLKCGGGGEGETLEMWWWW